MESVKRKNSCGHMLRSKYSDHSLSKILNTTLLRDDGSGITTLEDVIDKARVQSSSSGGRAKTRRFYQNGDEDEEKDGWGVTFLAALLVVATAGGIKLLIMLQWLDTTQLNNLIYWLTGLATNVQVAIDGTLAGCNQGEVVIGRYLVDKGVPGITCGEATVMVEKMAQKMLDNVEFLFKWGGASVGGATLKGTWSYYKKLARIILSLPCCRCDSPYPGQRRRD